MCVCLSSARKSQATTTPHWNRKVITVSSEIFSKNCFLFATTDLIFILDPHKYVVTATGLFWKAKFAAYLSSRRKRWSRAIACERKKEILLALNSSNQSRGCLLRSFVIALSILWCLHKCGRHTYRLYKFIVVAIFMWENTRASFAHIFLWVRSTSAIARSGQLFIIQQFVTFQAKRPVTWLFAN